MPQVDVSTLGVVTVNPLLGHYHLAKGWVAMSSVMDICNISADVDTGHFTVCTILTCKENFRYLYLDVSSILVINTGRICNLWMFAYFGQNYTKFG